MKILIKISVLAIVVYLLMMIGTAIALESMSALIPESVITMLTGLCMIGVSLVLRKRRAENN